MHKPLFITGIGTGVGKTLVSAIITEYLQADYWKPVQAGDLDCSDSNQVELLLTNTKSYIHEERFKFKLAASPHQAAAMEGVKMMPEDFQLPFTANRLVIEGAGGLMVPLNDTFLMVDLIQRFRADVVLVVRDYLGCINHSLLSYELLCKRGMNIKAIVFSGTMNIASAEAIVQQLATDIPIVQVPDIRQITKETIQQISSSFNHSLVI